MNIIGCKVEDLDTPALWVDLDIMEKNIATISCFLHDKGVAWRPHTKGIKIPAIARRLIEAGATGTTCAKLSEAEIMAAGGIGDILIANEVVGCEKISRLIKLCHLSNVIVAVDDLGNAAQISRAAVESEMKVKILLELDTGMQRCGIEPGPKAVDFAKQVCELPGVELAGLMSWEGHVVKISDSIEKKITAENSVNALVNTAKLCRNLGIRIDIVSCGGTGSYRISAGVPGVTEIQAGGGIFGDLTYTRWGGGVECGLFVLSTISSHPTTDRAIIDAGRKAISVDMTLPVLRDYPGAKFRHFSAEHGILDLQDSASQRLRVGDKVHLIVGYEDWTVFLHDRMFGVRNGRVDVIWEILGRGKIT